MPYMCHTETCRPDQGILFGLRIRDRVSFFEPDSKTGCQICEINPSQGAYSQYCLAPSHWFYLFLSFVQEINPSFDVFNIFIVVISHTVQEFVRVSFENSSSLCFDTLFLQAICPRILPLPPKTIGLITIENNRKISITKEICITIDFPKKSPEESQTPRQGVNLKISLRNRVTL